MTSPDAPAPRLASIDLRQMLLRTVDVERLVDDDHCVRSIWALVGLRSSRTPGSKERCGLRQFRCRGKLKATMEATWACLSYNLMRWFGLQRSRQAECATTA